MPEPLFEKIALIGIGLIGSSLARAVRRSIIEAGQEIDAPDFGRQAVEHPKG